MMKLTTIKKHKDLKRISGFTLVELILVIAIIGVLASIAMPVYQDYQEKAHVYGATTLPITQKSRLYDVIRINDGKFVDFASKF